MFEAVHNYHEKAVFELVADQAGTYPALAGDPELLGDVACVALNRVPPRYVRNKGGMTYYLDARERAEYEAAVAAAVRDAFEFVVARVAAGPRDCP